MKFSPGDILYTSGISFCPSISVKRGERDFPYNNTRCVLIDYKDEKKLPKKIVCTSLKNLEQQEVYYFKGKKFRNPVMNKLYQSGKIKNAALGIVRERWRQAAFNRCHSPRVTRFTPPKFHLTNDYLSWRYLETDLWEMPVPVPAYLNCINEKEKFTAQTLLHNNQINSPCYPLLYDKLPVRFSAKMDLVSTTEYYHPLDVDVYIHGFLEPRKMHFCIRKHVLACCGQASERKLWERLWDINIEDEACNAFGDCPKTQFDNSTCPTCMQETFTTVQKKNIHFYQKYQEQFVTNMIQQTTNSVKTEILLTSPELKLQAGSMPVRLQMNHEIWTGQMMRTVFAGAFYMSKQQDVRHVMHLSMMTLYFIVDHQWLRPPKAHHPLAKLSDIRVYDYEKS